LRDTELLPVEQRADDRKIAGRDRQGLQQRRRQQGPQSASMLRRSIVSQASNARAAAMSGGSDQVAVSCAHHYAKSVASSQSGS
jgi:hypothetical protein